MSCVEHMTTPVQLKFNAILPHYFHPTSFMCGFTQSKNWDLSFSSLTRHEEGNRDVENKFIFYDFDEVFFFSLALLIPLHPHHIILHFKSSIKKKTRYEWLEATEFFKLHVDWPRIWWRVQFVFWNIVSAPSIAIGTQFSFHIGINVKLELSSIDTLNYNNQSCMIATKHRKKCFEKWFIMPQVTLTIDFSISSRYLSMISLEIEHTNFPSIFFYVKDFWWQ